MASPREEALRIASAIVEGRIPAEKDAAKQLTLVATQLHFEARRASALRMMAKAMATMLSELLDKIGWEDLPSVKHAKETVEKLSATLAIEEGRAHAKS